MCCYFQAAWLDLRLAWPRHADMTCLSSFAICCYVQAAWLDLLLPWPRHVDKTCLSSFAICCYFQAAWLDLLLAWSRHADETCLSSFAWRYTLSLSFSAASNSVARTRGAGPLLARGARRRGLFRRRRPARPVEVCQNTLPGSGCRSVDIIFIGRQAFQYPLIRFCIHVQRATTSWPETLRLQHQKQSGCHFLGGGSASTERFQSARQLGK